MNRENVLRVADRIDGLPYEGQSKLGKQPKAFNMSSGCGSSCCIGGWTSEVFWGRYAALVCARDILGLNSAQARALFTPPGYAYIEYNGAIAAQVLRLMAAAGDNVTGKQILAFWWNPWD